MPAAAAGPAPRPRARLAALSGRPPRDDASRARIEDACGLVVSLMLHASLLLAGLVIGTPEPPPAQRQSPLAVELFGMLGRRQEARQAKGEDVERAAAPAARPAQAPRQRPPAPPDTARKEPRDEVPPGETASTAPSPGPVSEPAHKPAPSPATADAPSPSAEAAAGAQASARGTEEQRVQQTVQRQELPPDLMRKYLAALTKAIQRRLAYPAQARAEGATGAPVVRFVITGGGEILPGSLGIQRSSGHGALDEAALRAVLASAPLEPPARQMTVVLTLSFVQEL